MTNTTTLRNEYRALQIASGMTPEDFRADVLGMAYERADGEEPDMSPAHLTDCAREVSYYAAKRRGRAA
jgi:hypothetical protein